MSFDESVDYFTKNRMRSKLTVDYSLKTNIDLNMVNIKSISVTEIVRQRDNSLNLKIKMIDDIYSVILSNSKVSRNTKDVLNNSGNIRIYNIIYYNVIPLINKIIRLIGIKHYISTDNIRISFYSCYYKPYHRLIPEDLKHNNFIKNIKHSKADEFIRASYDNNNILNCKGNLDIKYYGKTVTIRSQWLTSVKFIYEHIYSYISIPKMLIKMNKNKSYIFSFLPTELIDVIICLLKN